MSDEQIRERARSALVDAIEAMLDAEFNREDIEAEVQFQLDEGISDD